RFGLGKHGFQIGCACSIFILLIVMLVWLGLSEVLIQLLGLVGMLLILKSSTFQDNRHKRTASSLGGALTTSQMGLLHAWGGMLQTGLATARAFLMAALPDEMKKLRLAATIVFYGMALCVYQFFLPPSPYNIL